MELQLVQGVAQMHEVNKGYGAPASSRRAHVAAWCAGPLVRSSFFLYSFASLSLSFPVIFSPSVHIPKLLYPRLVSRLCLRGSKSATNFLLIYVHAT